MTDRTDENSRGTPSASFIGLNTYPALATVQPFASCTGIVSISPETYARLLSLADQAPLDCLPLTSRTLASAKTLGYNQIGQIRSASHSRLQADLGKERAEELRRALYDFGMRQPGAAEAVS